MRTACQPWPILSQWDGPVNCGLCPDVYKRQVLFRPVEKLLPGDLVLVTNPWKTLTYEVVEIKVVEAYETQEILIQPGRDLLTLLTCAYPNDRRVLVLCEREE